MGNREPGSFLGRKLHWIRSHPAAAAGTAVAALPLLMVLALATVGPRGVLLEHGPSRTVSVTYGEERPPGTAAARKATAGKAGSSSHQGTATLPWKVGDTIAQGWTVAGLMVHREFIRYALQHGDQYTSVEVTHSGRSGRFKTRLYLVQPSPGARPPLPLLDAIRDKLQRYERRGKHRPFVEQASGPPSENRFLGSPSLITANPTLLLQLLLLLATVLLALRIHRLGTLARRIEAYHWAQLGLWTGIGLVLRLLGGIRVPGFTNCEGHAHGFGVLREILVHNPRMNDPHGAGLHALHGLSTAIFPRTELTVIAVQLALSVCCIPLTFIVARVWLRETRGAIWAAAVQAVLPTTVFFAATEVRLVPGVFFLLLTLAMLGVATRDRHPVTMIATVILGLLTTQFYPILMITPAVMLLMLVSTPEGRALLRWRWTHLATAAFTVLWLVPALWMLHLIRTRQGSAIGGDFLRVFGLWDLLFLPAMEIDRSRAYNVFLATPYTPVVISGLGLVGLASGVLRRPLRLATLGILVTALVLTFPGLWPGRMNLARLQLAAQPFYAMLAGAGLGWLLGRLEASRAVVRWMPTTAGVIVILGAVALWPGPIGARFALQNERRFFLEALPHLEDHCLVFWAPGERGPNQAALPIYLAEEAGRTLQAHPLRTLKIPTALVDNKDRCVYYYRASTCFTVLRGPHRRERLQPLCAKVEAQLSLERVYTRKIAALPDDTPNYHGQTIEIGFYRVRGWRSRP